MSRCPFCSRVLTDRDSVVGTCVACGKPLPARYRSPGSPGGLGAEGSPWVVWAACFSAIAAPAMLIAEGVFRREAAMDPELPQKATVLLGILVVVMMAGLVLGIVALLIAFKNGSWRTAAWSAFGVLGNAGILAAWVQGAVFHAP